MSDRPMRAIELNGKRVLVTGAARGIGLAIAEAFVELGALVLLTDVEEPTAAAHAERLGARSLRCDVTAEREVERAVGTVVEVWGGVDVVINNAGIEASAPLVEHTAEEFARIMAVNATGTFLGIKHGARAIADSGGGAIVNLASVAAVGGMPHGAAYAASKAAVVSLTQTAALELRTSGVRVNAVCPGFIDTDMFARALPELESMMGAAVLPVVEQIQHRLGKPIEVAQTVAFLASEASSFINGAAVPVDNALTARVI